MSQPQVESGSDGLIVPFHRFWNGHDHFYTANESEVETASLHGYSPEGVACAIYNQQVSGSVPLYRYWNERDHLYTTNADEIGTTTPGTVGKNGYKSDGIAGYCYPTQVEGTIPLYRYFNRAGGDHYYTTDSEEMGTTIHGEVGKDNYQSEGIQCFVRGKHD